MSSTQIIVIVVVIAVVLVLAAVALALSQRARMRRRLGPEYDRLVAERGGRLAAERELWQRQRRHAQLSIKPLSNEARARYTAAWEEVQARFVDDPAAALSEADTLVTRVMSERGYPTEGYDDQLAELSVEHGNVLGHYRAAHEVYQPNERGEATTEDRRQALVHYRALFTDLLGLQPDEHVPGGHAPNAQVPNGQAPNGQVPNGQVPADQVAADQVAADQVAADQVPADQVPADQVPADQMPADQVPAGRAPGRRVSARRDGRRTDNA
jgi:hypothetical protein